MVSIDARRLGPAFATFTDDTEESVLGSSLHQGAIMVLHDGLEACGPERNLPWCVSNQLRMVIPRLGQRALSLSPDLLVHPTLGNAPRDALDIATEGPPTLVIEVASPSTARDRDLAEGAVRGKPAVYAALGIAEYLVFDPTGEYVPEGLWARHLGPDGQTYQPWEAAADQRWHSQLGISFQPQGFLLRVYDQEGVLVATRPEQRSALTKNARDIAERDHQLAQRDHQLAQMQTDYERRIAALEAALQRLQGEH